VTGGQWGMYFTGKLRLFAAVAVMTLVSCMPQQSATPACSVPTPSTPPGIPIDVCGTLFDATEFGPMAWQTFKTLVWPAASRGVADATLKITETTGRSLVFETYKADWETFHAFKTPLAWDEYPKTASVCQGESSTKPLANNELVLASLNKFGNLDQADLLPPQDPGDEPPPPPRQGEPPPPRTGEVVFYLTIAQNGTPVRYLSSFGKVAYESIVKNNLYQPDVSRPRPSMAPPVAPPNPGATRMDVGTITIKSAWIEMTGFDPRRFHTRVALLQHPLDKTCREALVGLVGLHIAHKTEVSPQWIWASFEHVDNAPYRGKPPTQPHYTFNKPENGQNGRMPDHPPLDSRVPTDTQKEFTIPQPYNVERLREIAPALQELNKKWREMLADEKVKSVWANYELVTVQWPRHKYNKERIGAGRNEGEWLGAFPTPPCGSITPEASPNVSNSVIETFLQAHTRCHWDLTCMSCHNRARNYDFVWSIPLAHKKTPAGDPSAARRAALTTLYEVVGQSQQPAAVHDQR